MRMTLFSIPMVAAVMMAGCAAETDEVGTVGVALTATDPTGAVYRLPDGAQLVIQGGAYYDAFSLDGDSAFVRINVPAGDYSAELIDDAGHNGTTLWPLTRRNVDGTTETVNAVLTTPMPAPMTITENGQTNLVLHFNVPDIGPVTFAEGSVDVSLDVDQVAASDVTAVVDGMFDVIAVTVDPSAPPQLAPRLPAVGDPAVQFVLEAHLTGPWAKSSSLSACAPVEMRLGSASQPGLNDLLTEATTGGLAFRFAQLCIYDNGTGVNSTADLFFYRNGIGTATTATFADLGEQNWMFLTSMSLELPRRVFDGHVLDLHSILGTHSGAASALVRASVRPTGSTTRVHWYRTTVQGASVALNVIAQ